MKTQHALIYPRDQKTVVERRLIDPAEIPEQKKSWWRPVVAIGNDDYDKATHVKTGPVTTIEESRVVDTWTIRPKTAEEIDAEKDFRISGIDKLQFAIHFDAENRLRALEGKQPITAAQYRNALKARL